MLRSHPFAVRSALFLVLPAIVLLAVGRTRLRAGLPQTRGTVALHGLSAPVAVTRDAHGVPHIRARSDRDAFFAMGYVQAQDRLWQLEVQRRTAQGRLAEIFGRDSVAHDVWLRTLGLQASAREAWDALGPEARDSLTAFADGVNAWIEGHDALPPEFQLVGVRPEPWTVFDSLAWIKMFALDLGGNFRQELSHATAARVLSQGQFRALFGRDPEAPASRGSVKAMAGLLGVQRGLEQERGLGGRYVGSNAWVVSGKHTRDRRPLLANDTHLGLRIPSLWYVVDLEGDRARVRGMSLVGLPVVVFGCNRDICWGGTSMTADVQDLYLERAHPDGAAYEVEGGWTAFDARSETIAVKADFPAALRDPLEPVTIRVRRSRHGPIVSDPHVTDTLGALDHPMALRWTALDADDTSYEAFHRLTYASDWNTFQEALHHHVAPALNMLYADGAGNVGFLGAGRIPRRARGEGLEPVPGWTRAFEWTGFVPPQEWPRSYNPPEGYVVSANQRLARADYPHFISHDWAPPARAERIEELLRSGIAAGGLDAAAMARIQADTLNRPAARLAAYLLARYEPAGPHQERAYRYLRGWNGDMAPASQAATIFHVWIGHLRHRLFGDELRVSWGRDGEARALEALEGGIELEDVRAALEGGDVSWCDDVTTPAAETCAEILRESFEAARWEVFKIQGDDSMESWGWGRVHRTYYRHTPFSGVRGLGRWFERRIENGGSGDSVNVANAEYAGSDGYLQTFGAGFRQVAQPGDAGVLHYMNSTGQSGHPMSPHYDDMVQPFRNAELFRMDAATPDADMLVLQPAGGTKAVAAASTRGSSR